MIDVNLNGAEPTHVDRIKPEFSIDSAGNINWLPGLIDHNAAVFHRGKTVTNDEYNTLFLKGVYQGNYTADSLQAFFKDHLSTAIGRKFENMYNLHKSYTQVFSTSDWGEKQADGYYYITIPATVHGIQPLEQNTGVDRISVDTEMYVLDGEKLLEVSQVYVEIDNTVTLYTDDPNLTGFVIIRLNDKAFVSPGASISVSQIFDIADVAKTGAYTDLKGLNDVDGPNYRLTELEETLSQITAGELVIPKAEDAAEATNATNVTGSIRNISLDDIFEPGSSTIKNATNVTGTLQNIPLSSILEGDTGMVKTALVAHYASADGNKGTIEERLTRLGFKKGTIQISDNTNYSALTPLYVYRQGNYILIPKIQIVANNKTMHSIDKIDDTDVRLVLPEGFRPAEKVLVNCVYDQSFSPGSQVYIDYGRFEIDSSGVFNKLFRTIYRQNTALGEQDMLEFNTIGFVAADGQLEIV